MDWEEVDVRYAGELTDNELRAIELEENIRRKDLTEYEKSRDMVELVQVVREQIKEETCAESAQVLGKGGRGKSEKSPGSYRDIAARTGIPESTIRAAEQHVQAVDKYPDLKELPKKEAIKRAKVLDNPRPRHRISLSPLHRMACTGFKMSW